MKNEYSDLGEIFYKFGRTSISKDDSLWWQTKLTLQINYSTMGILYLISAMSCILILFEPTQAAAKRGGNTSISLSQTGIICVRHYSCWIFTQGFFWSEPQLLSSLPHLQGIIHLVGLIFQNICRFWLLLTSSTDTVFFWATISTSCQNLHKAPSLLYSLFFTQQQ